MIEHRIGTSRRSDAVHAISKLTIGPVMKWGPLTSTTMKLFPLIDRAADRLPRSGRCSHREIVARTWRGELVTPIDGTTSDGAILYLHGGAFLACGLGTHRRLVERLAWRTGMAVLAVDYRQLPVGILDDSLQDAEDAFRWLTRNGHPAHHIVLAGDSAGGHLAFATAIKMRDAGLTGHVVAHTFQGVSTTVSVRLNALDTLIAVHEVGSVEGRLELGDEVKVQLDGRHAVVESAS